MKTQICLHVDGDSFDAAGFSKGNLPLLDGQALKYHRLNDGVVEEYGDYWKSELWDIEFDDLSDKLNELIIKYEAKILAASQYGGTRIIADIVVAYAISEPARGYYFTDKTIALLCGVGASLSIDVITDLDSVE